MLFTVSIDSIHEGDDGQLIKDREDSSEHESIGEPRIMFNQQIEM